MSPFLPPPMLLFARLSAFFDLWPRLQVPRSSLRTVFDAVVITVLMVALVWAA